MRYTVFTLVPEARFKEWLRWMLEHHIPHVRSTGLLTEDSGNVLPCTSSDLWNPEDCEGFILVQCEYGFKDKADHDFYHSEAGNPMRADYLSKKWETRGKKVYTNLTPYTLDHAA